MASTDASTGDPPEGPLGTGGNDQDADAIDREANEAFAAVAADADDADESEHDDVPATRVQRPAKLPHAPVAAAPRDGLVWAVVAAAVVIGGWIFIAAIHRFRITVPSAVLSLGWLAVVSAVYTLFRTGTAASDEDDDRAAWWRPTGKRDELEREKRSLLKAIKEIEFDREMGKLSPADAGELMRTYRAHAIEVIKAIDQLDAGGPGSVRDEIEREVRARMAVSGAVKRKKGDKLVKVKTGKETPS